MDITFLCFDLPGDPTEQAIEQAAKELVGVAAAEHGGLFSLRPPIPPGCQGRIIESGEYRVRCVQAYDFETAQVQTRLDLQLIDLDKEVALGSIKLV